MFTLVTTKVRNASPHMLVELPDPVCQDM